MKTINTPAHPDSVQLGFPVLANVRNLVRGWETGWSGEGDPLSSAIPRNHAISMDVYIISEGEDTLSVEAAVAPLFTQDGHLDVENTVWAGVGQIPVAATDVGKPVHYPIQHVAYAYRLRSASNVKFKAYVWTRG